MCSFTHTTLGIGFAVWTCLVAIGAPADSPDFERQILPLLYNRCFSCHSEKPREPKGELRLDTAQGIRGSGVIDVERPDESEVLRRVSLPHSDPDLMPPLKGGGQPLNEAERALLRQWIAGGAKLGAWKRFNHREPAVEFHEAPLTRADVPELVQKLDGLVRQFHEKYGNSLNPRASDETFLRRVYLDVAGRIPSYSETRRFLENQSTRKRADLIDVLLDSEAYVSHTFNWKADQLRLVTKGIPGQPGWAYDEWVKDSIRSGMAYDEFVRRLVTASGYLWENGAAGFYLRDLGMPLDHMSNLTRIFLGTRIECAQCHDHPFEPITQQDFYQLTAYTFGVSNLYSSAGYSTDNVNHWPELSKRLDEMNAPTALREAASRTVAPLKRLTKDTEHRLEYPETYAADPSARGQLVEFRTPFGDEAPATSEDRRTALAAWMTSPRNPRFTRNIVNRSWKRVFGAGLIEPVDSLSPVNRPQQPEVLDFLTQSMAQLEFDERALLAVLLNSRLYQSESQRHDLEPGDPFPLRGPLLRRLSAEQLWDSLLVLLVEDLDERTPPAADQGLLSREQLRKLTNMNGDELFARSKFMMEYFEVRRRHTLDLENQKRALQRAKDQNDSAGVQRLQQEHAKANARFDSMHQSLSSGPPSGIRGTDPRWVRLSPTLLRASEIPTPIPLGHFLRQFGQSDRREIDAFNKSPNMTHSLALMNGELTRSAMRDDCYLRASLRSLKNDQQRAQALYQSILVRSPTDEEATRCRELFATSPTAEADLIWALLNTPEFLFIE